MNKGGVLLVAACVMGGLVLLMRRQEAGQTQAEGGFFLPDMFGFLKTSAGSASIYGVSEDDMEAGGFKTSLTSGRGKPYFAELELVTGKYNLPKYMIPRIAYQESRYRDDVIRGLVSSSAGARGMFQFMPITELHISQIKAKFDPLNWRQAADAAGFYLAWLYRQLGDWPSTIAAYNWGIGSVKKHKAANGGRLVVSKLPKETRDYVTYVCRDLAISWG
ncbi:lytic transglycosylase domain-containing protein [Chitinibacteraceae bacterium HSL-7]